MADEIPTNRFILWNQLVWVCNLALTGAGIPLTDEPGDLDEITALANRLRILRDKEQLWSDAGS